MYLMEVPLGAEGGLLLVQVDDGELNRSLELASLRPGQVVAQASHTLDSTLQTLGPMLETLRKRIGSIASDEVAVEFGVVLGAETGVVIAKGTSEVHFQVTLTWKR